MSIKLPNFRTDDVNEFIHNFVFNDALIELVSEFGGRQYPKDNIEDCINFLADFSNIWDYRSRLNTATETNEKARWLISKESFSDSQIRAIKKASKEIGLKDNSQPLSDRYDYVWILGGAKLSCLLRSKLAKEVVQNLKNHPKNISMLASFRPINESERLATDTYAIEAETEFDLFISAHKMYFDSSVIKTNESDSSAPLNKQWRILEFENKTSIFSAPSREPELRRANSLDTYLFFLEHYTVEPGSRILLITSEIYVPYQHIEAFRSVALPKNVSIETIGFPSDWGGELQGMSNDENYLQEIRSTILSVKRLFDERCK